MGSGGIFTRPGNADLTQSPKKSAITGPLATTSERPLREYSANKMTRKYEKLTDARVSTLHDFADAGPYVFWDTVVRGLRLRVGRNKTTWAYFVERQFRGKRSSTFRTLGYWPRLDTKAARKAALTIAGREAAGRIEQSPRAAPKFQDAVARYIEHLREQSARRGKPAEWARAIEYMNAKHLSRWHLFTLKELANAPDTIEQWHKELTRKAGPVAANKAAKVLRSIYFYSAKRDRSLPPFSPTSSVTLNPEESRETGINDFAAWARAWHAMENPTRKAYALFLVLTGMRPGEAARLQWADLRVLRCTIVLKKSKTGRDIEIPLSRAIVHALRMARAASPNSKEIFPNGPQNNPKQDRLPAHGNTLRHSFASVAKSVGVDQVLLKILLGHSLGKDITSAYLSREMLRLPLRQAQQKISAEFVRRLGLTR
jgi:integrase